MSSAEKFRIRDTVHGFIHFNELERSVIDHPVFQRLRNINQLGWTHYIYPGATHKRFEHSIGVMHLSSRVLDHLYYHQRDKETREIMHRYLGDENEYRVKRQIFRISSLLHDLGHPPFSHSGEDLFNLKSEEKHEKYTVSLIKKYIPEVIDSSTDRDVNTYNINSNEVADYILKKIPLLNEILSGTIDVDRADYLLRDSIHLGVEYGKYDLNRLLDSFILREGDNEYEPISLLHLENGGKEAAFSFLMARYLMFSQVYFHKTRRIMDMHFRYAMKDILVEMYGKPYYPGLNDLDEFVKLDDNLILLKMNEMKNKSDSCKRLLDREHYRCVLDNERIDPEYDKLVENMKNYLDKRKIPYFEDKYSKSSYNKGSIFILDKEGKSIPLETHYPSLEKITAYCNRIYVPKEKREEVLKWREEN